MVNVCVTALASSPHLSNAHEMKSDELKATMKESPRRYTNPFLSDEENDKVNFWNNPEHVRSIVEDDFTTNLEDEKFRKSLSTCNVPSESFEKPKELYVDKNVMECELPELIACYEESGFHVVKDICVDEGLPHGEKILIDKEHHELFCNPFLVNGDKHDDMIEDDLSTQFSNHEQLRYSPLEDCYMNAECFVANEKLDTDFPIPELTNDHRNIGYSHDDMIGLNLDTRFLKHERMRSSSLEACYTNPDLSFGTKEKADTDLLIPEPTNDDRDMGKCSDTEIPVQDGQNSPQGKDCEEDTTKECGTQAKVAIHSVIPNALKNASKDDNGPSNCAPDDLKLFVKSNIVQNAENCGPDNSMQTGEGKLDSSSNSLNNSSIEQLISSNMLSLNQDQPLTSIKVLGSSNNGVDDVDQQLSQIQSPEEENLKRSLAGSEAEELGRSIQTTNISNEIKMEENVTSNFGTVKPATIGGSRGTDDPECVHELSLETLGAPNHQDVASDNLTMANQLQRGEGESSFSVVGPVSGLITHSGPIASSGSISLRSDSSTTSARSFAFPVLQTEWNSSPVRMAKADRRRSQRHQGWRKALLCCRF